jgi:serine/threonine-protein kinase
MKSTINPQNCRMLREWADLGKLDKYSGTPNAAKKILKDELEKLKPKILLKIEAATTKHAQNSSRS